MTSPESRLDAPHRRARARSGADRANTRRARIRPGVAGPRLVERAAVAGYQATSWLLGMLPEGPARALIGRMSQVSYVLWPAKRRWSNQNFGHVLGLPPEDPRVRDLAQKAYREYGRYLVELMRLPSMSPDDVGLLASDMDVDEIKRLWRGAPGGGLIFAVGHVGNNEAVAAGIAHHGMPISVVADDTAFPELYELLRKQRESWGVRVIAWRNLREIFGVLKRREMLALLIDWGYRSDGIPVQLFGAWTALPAGPATLAAKTGSRILPISIRRVPERGFAVSWAAPIDVPANDPAALQRATQAMADALAASIAIAPEQWYSFKPIWPAGEAEAADLERRASIMLAGRPDPGPGRGIRRDEADAEPLGAPA